MANLKLLKEAEWPQTVKGEIEIIGWWPDRVKYLYLNPEKNLAGSGYNVELYNQSE